VDRDDTKAARPSRPPSIAQEVNFAHVRFRLGDFAVRIYGGLVHDEIAAGRTAAPNRRREAARGATSKRRHFRGRRERRGLRSVPIALAFGNSTKRAVRMGPIQPEIALRKRVSALLSMTAASASRRRFQSPGAHQQSA